MDSLQTGSEVDGFRLGEVMHVGSMASIYRLAGPQGELPLVIKIPRLGGAERAVNVIAFEVCRMVLGALAQGRSHPTLVAFGDVETTPYLVMEYIEGARLHEWVQRAPVSADEIARLGSALALALHEIHLQDVVHLDLKPTNVLYRRDGHAVLVDFGLAHHSHYPDLLAEELRFPVGNWVYMAPEQVLGVRCDPRSDIYALGGLLYELATGRTPHGHPRSTRELRRRLYRDPIPPRALVAATPGWLQEVILRCLELDARDRYTSAAEVAFDLVNPGDVDVGERGRRDRAPGWSMRVRRCVTAVPPSAALSGERYEETATGRHIKQLVELRRWARPLQLPEERVTYHVLESDKPAGALIDYAKLNEVDQILIGAPREAAARLFRGVSEQVVADAPCTVTVVRPRTDA